jgi:N-acetylmuramoyl-L-alanine amidase
MGKAEGGRMSLDGGRIIFTKPNRKVSRIFLHCSASDNPKHDNIGTIDRWHKERKPPFKEIGYHFYIDKLGRQFTGRDIEKIPAAQKGHNTGTIAICCGGLKDFPVIQMDSLKKLCQIINKAYNGQVTFHGHREVEPGKTCPVYKYQELLNLNEKGQMI